MLLSNRIQNLEKNNKSSARGELEKLRLAGREIITLNLGEADFATPDYILTGAARAMQDGYTRYTPTEGCLPLREAICRKLQQENALSYQTEDILVTAGAKQAIANAIFALCGPGDEVLIPIPCWDSYPQIVRLAEAVPVMLPLAAGNNFLPEPEEWQRYVTPRTKCLILNNPHNPTGQVYSAELLRSIAAFACRNNLYVIADEIYEYLVYEGEVQSLAALAPEIKERTITVNGFSKAFAMTGWRLGYAAGPREIIDAMKAVQNYTTSNPNSIAQMAGLTALNAGADAVRTMVAEFARRRDLITAKLAQIDGIHFPYPQGAFYVLADISRFFGRSYQGQTLLTADDFVRLFLQEADILVSGGENYYAPDCIRISYANSEANIELALARMEVLLKKLEE